jgi:E3 ubiquitin-protein ligase HECW2
VQGKCSPLKFDGCVIYLEFVFQNNNVEYLCFCYQAPIPPPRPLNSNTALVQRLIPDIPTAYNEKVVAFLRQANIMDILKERHAAIATSQSLRDKVNAIRVDGTVALDRLCDDIDLTILLR